MKTATLRVQGGRKGSSDWDFIDRTQKAWTIKEIFGHEKVEKIEFDDGTDINVNGIFIAQGTADSTDIAKKIGLVLENNKTMESKDCL